MLGYFLILPDLCIRLKIIIFETAQKVSQTSQVWNSENQDHHLPAKLQIHNSCIVHPIDMEKPFMKSQNGHFVIIWSCMLRCTIVFKNAGSMMSDNNNNKNDINKIMLITTLILCSDILLF